MLFDDENIMAHKARSRPRRPRRYRPSAHRVPARKPWSGLKPENINLYIAQHLLVDAGVFKYTLKKGKHNLFRKSSVHLINGLQVPYYHYSFEKRVKETKAYFVFMSSMLKRTLT